jgi:hypothetical protein
MQLSVVEWDLQDRPSLSKGSFKTRAMWRKECGVRRKSIQ